MKVAGIIVVVSSTVFIAVEPQVGRSIIAICSGIYILVNIWVFPNIMLLLFYFLSWRPLLILESS